MPGGNPREHMWELESQGIENAITTYGLQGQLEGVQVKGITLSEQALDYLGRTVSLKQWLNLRDTGLTDDDLKHFATLTRLESLDISGSKITGGGLDHLSWMKDLERLSLSSTPLTDDGLSHLPELPSLKKLSLKDCRQVTDLGLKHLETFQQLEELDLSGSGISDAGLAQIRGSLPNCRITY